MSRLSPTFGRFLGRQPCPPNFSRNDPLYAIKLPSVSPKDPFPRAYVDTSLDEISFREIEIYRSNEEKDLSGRAAKWFFLKSMEEIKKHLRAPRRKSRFISLSLSFSRRIIIAFCKFFKNIIVEEIGNRKGRQREI